MRRRVSPASGTGRAARSCALALLLAGLGAALAHAPLGAAVPEREMPTPEGARQPLLGDGVPTVLVFIRPEQARSKSALGELAPCQAALAGRALRWSVVVSDSSDPKAASALVRDSAFSAAILIDERDTLTTSLGVVQHPALLLVDAGGRLAAFEPFRSVNFCDVVTARIRHLLKEIPDQDLQAALEPPAAPVSGQAAAARRLAALAEALLERGLADKALAYARASVEKDAASPASHALLGDVLAARGDCTQALKAYTAALAIDDTNARARAGTRRCSP